MNDRHRHQIIPGTVLPLFLTFIFLFILKPAAVKAGQTVPLSGQYAISKAIGANQPKYHANPRGLDILLENITQDFSITLFKSGNFAILHGMHHIRMRLVSCGYGGNVQQVATPVLQYADNQITYNHGRIKQWFVNGPMGLQQGFTINKRPEHASSRNFTLSLNVDSDLLPCLDGDEHGVSFFDKDGTTVFQYSGLMVADARNQQLPAHMEVNNNQIGIVVDDRNAIYPVTVDPIFQQAKLTASDGGDHDIFGWAVAAQGNIVVVGAPGHDIGGNNGQGAAYVFEKSPSGWNNLTKIAQLTASDGMSGDAFGTAIANKGNIIVATAKKTFDKGAAYVFVRPSGGWHDMTETAKLTASDGDSHDQFGKSMAMDRDTVVVGAFMDSSPGHQFQGSVYVFVRPSGGWHDMTETAKLVASDGDKSDYLGRSVAIDDDIIVAGASGDNNFQGSVYVYAKPPSGWADMSQTAKLMASDRNENDFLGFAVAMDKDTIVAGAPGFHTSSQPNLGAAYVFVRSGQHWTDMEETTELRAGDRLPGDSFGHAVAIDGNTIVIGSPYHNYSGIAGSGMPFLVSNMGAVYSFTKPANGWPFDMRAKAEMVSNDGHADDHLGSSVAITGKTVVAGTPYQDVNGREQQGAAYVFRLKNNYGSHWPMFISAITSKRGHIIAINKAAGHPTSCNCVSTHRIFLGSLVLSYANNVMPHFNVQEESACYIEMPVIGDIGFLDCPSVTWRWDADENDGQMRIRRSATIIFNPTGTCSKSGHSCTVLLGANGSETIWQWYSTDNGLTWTLVPGMPYTMPIDWLNTPIYFDNIDLIDGGNDSFSISTSGGKATFDLWLFPVCGKSSCD